MYTCVVQRWIQQSNQKRYFFPRWSVQIRSASNLRVQTLFTSTLARAISFADTFVPDQLTYAEWNDL